MEQSEGPVKQDPWANFDTTQIALAIKQEVHDPHDSLPSADQSPGDQSSTTFNLASLLLNQPVVKIPILDTDINDCNYGDKEDRVQLNRNDSNKTRKCLGPLRYPCDECSDRFRWKKELREHMHEVHEQLRGVHVCVHCGECFRQKKELKQHVANAHDAFRHKCPECGEYFRFKKQLKEHELTHSLNKSFNGEIEEFLNIKTEQDIKQENFESDDFQSGKNDNYDSNEAAADIDNGSSGEDEAFPSDFDAESNQESSSSEYEEYDDDYEPPKKRVKSRRGSGKPKEQGPFICETCGKEFPKRHKLNSHMRCHEPHEKKHGCDICGKMFTTRRYIRIHKLIHTGERPHLCTECGMSFKRGYHLKQHYLALHSDQDDSPQHKCPECDKVFKLKGNLTQHMLLHTQSKSHLCPTCGRSFHRIFHLKQHMVTHSDERLYQCQKCSKMFKQKGNLTQHMLLHSRQEKPSCPDCGKKFSRLNYIKKHAPNCPGKNGNMYVPDPLKPFVCYKCEKAYKTQSKLNEHMISHMETKPFPCNLCSKSFASRSKLATHEMIHSGEKPHMCGFCSQRFTQKCNLKKHLEVKHFMLPSHQLKFQ